MMLKSTASLLGSLLLGALLAACVAPVDGTTPAPEIGAGEPVSKPIPVTVSALQTYTQCPQRFEQEHATVFGSAKAWAAHQTALGAQARLLPRLAASFDWSKHSVLLVGLGVRTSAGHGFDLVQPTRLVDKELQVLLALRQPAAGSMQAMVMTQPCAYYLVESQNYERVSVGPSQPGGAKSWTHRRAP